MAKQPFQTLKRYRYKDDSEGVKRYLKMVNSSRGVISDDYTKDILGKYSDFEFHDDEHAQSLYKPEELFSALKAYDHSYKFQPNQDILSTAVKRTKNMFSSLKHSLSPITSAEVVWHTDANKAAGAPHFSKKGEVLKDWQEDLSKVGTDPCVAYYRTQNRRSDEGEFKQKVRLIWGYPLDTLIAEGKYARPAIEKLIGSKTPYALGYTKVQLGSILNDFAWAPWQGTFDWSRFDSTMPKQIVAICFEIIKSWFVEGSVNDLEWKKIVKYFMHTPILMPDGRVYFNKQGGIPSGSYFTGIVGSLANLILIQYLTLEQDVEIMKDLFFVMGDDSIIGMREHLDVNRMTHVAEAHFGMVLHPEKQRYSRYNEEVSFLSHQWFRCRASRPIEETLTKLVYSENSWNTKESSIKDIRIQRLYSAYADNHKFWPILAKWETDQNLIYEPLGRESYHDRLTDKTTEVNAKPTRLGYICLMAIK